MKKIFVLLTTLFILGNATAQDCVADNTLPDTAVGVFPLPYSANLNPTGGIKDTACINERYRFVFTIAVAPTFNTSFGPISINSVEFATTGALTNIPKGVTYACNPPNCVFPKNTKGCVVLYGTPNDTAGVYNLKITGLIRSAFDISLTFPDPSIYPGNYYLILKPTGQCRTTDTDDIADLEISAQNNPNPFNGMTQLVINTKENGNFDFTVSDLLGKQVHRERLNLWEGENNVDFDGSRLAAGVYVYTISNGDKTFSGKMSIYRN